MFIGASFITVKTGNQPRCPSLGEWINKLGYVSMEYYSSLKRNERLRLEKTSGLNRSLRKRSQPERGHILKYMTDIQEKAKLWKQKDQ